MDKHEIIIVANYSDDTLSLHQICEICQTKPRFIVELIEHDIIHPTKSSNEDYFFSGKEIKRVKKALRLQQTFELSIANLALVLSLLDERDALLEHNAILERHIFWRE